MTGIVEVSSNVANDTRPTEWPGIVSRFQLVILATHRSKQLLLGAQPRIVADRLKRRNTSIALEELRRGLILFKPVAVEEARGLRILSPVIGPLPDLRNDTSRYLRA
jgi:DNA-directed RNA polymerase omega subunit